MVCCTTKSSLSSPYFGRLQVQTLMSIITANIHNKLRVNGIFWPFSFMREALGSRLRAYKVIYYTLMTSPHCIIRQAPKKLQKENFNIISVSVLFATAICLQRTSFLFLLQIIQTKSAGINKQNFHTTHIKPKKDPSHWSAWTLIYSRWNRFEYSNLTIFTHHNSRLEEKQRPINKIARNRQSNGLIFSNRWLIRFGRVCLRFQRVSIVASQRLFPNEIKYEIWNFKWQPSMKLKKLKLTEHRKRRSTTNCALNRKISNWFELMRNRISHDKRHSAIGPMYFNHSQVMSILVWRVCDPVDWIYQENTQSAIVLALIKCFRRYFERRLSLGIFAKLLLLLTLLVVVSVVCQFNFIKKPHILPMHSLYHPSIHHYPWHFETMLCGPCICERIFDVYFTLDLSCCAALCVIETMVLYLSLFSFVTSLSVAWQFHYTIQLQRIHFLLSY